jgi:hypothetical protein
MGWAFFYMFVILKIPICAALYLVWWAVKQDTSEVDPPSNDRHWRHTPRPPRPRRPIGPRRGPHACRPPASPQRIRARGKRLQRTHG